MKHIKILLVSVLGIISLYTVPAMAQQSSAQVYATCGTAPYVAGQIRLNTQDTTGASCIHATVSATVTVAPATTTNASGTIATGGVFQSILASNAARVGCLVQNPTTATEPLYVFFGLNASATTAKSISLAAGASVNCAVGGLGVATDNVSATATNSGESAPLSPRFAARLLSRANSS